MRSTKATPVKATSINRIADNNIWRISPLSTKMIRKNDNRAGTRKRTNNRFAGKTPIFRASSHNGKDMINNSKMGLLIRYSHTNWRINNTGFTYLRRRLNSRAIIYLFESRHFDSADQITQNLVDVLPFHFRFCSQLNSMPKDRQCDFNYVVRHSVISTMKHRECSRALH